MSLLSEFQEITEKMQDEIANIMQTEVFKETKKVITDEAMALHYSNRDGRNRGSLYDDTKYHLKKYSRSGDTHEIIVEGRHTFQGAQWGDYLSTVVNEGWSNWRQPGPRPYMTRAEQIINEKAADIVASELVARGF